MISLYEKSYSKQVVLKTLKLQELLFLSEHTLVLSVSALEMNANGFHSSLCFKQHLGHIRRHQQKSLWPMMDCTRLTLDSY